jgi:tetratricopeptide (TPR) repeat protein
MMRRFRLLLAATFVSLCSTALAQSIPDDRRKANDANNQCWKLVIKGVELDRALSYCNDALAILPKDANTLDSRGFTYFRMGRNADAISDLDAALSVNSRLTGSLFVRGLAKLQVGDVAGGNNDISAAMAQNPNIALNYAAYGIESEAATKSFPSDEDCQVMAQVAISNSGGQPMSPGAPFAFCHPEKFKPELTDDRPVGEWVFSMSRPKYDPDHLHASVDATHSFSYRNGGGGAQGFTCSVEKKETQWQVVSCRRTFFAD